MNFDSGQLYAANHSPVAPYSWEVQATLLRTNLDTGRLPLRWNRPVEILGMYASVLQHSSEGGGLFVPTADAIACALSANQQDRFTSRLEMAAQTGSAENFVTLASLTVQVPRLVRIQLKNESPQLDVEFRWKTNNPASPTFEDAFVSLTFFCRYMT